MPHDPIGGVIQNLLTLQRLGNGVKAEAALLIDELSGDLAGQIARLDPTLPEREAYRRERLAKLLGEIDPLVGGKLKEVLKIVRQRLAEIGAHQASWAEHQLWRSIGSVAVDIKSGGLSVNFMKSILDIDPFQGETLKGWTQVQADACVRRVRQQLQLGVTQNETLDQLIRRIRGDYAGRNAVGEPRFTGGVLGTTTRETEAIVRTGVNFIATRGHAATYKQNADILKGLEIVAVLDSRTTMICMGLDGKEISVDSTDLPPYHYNCRTTVVPVIDWNALGIEAPADGTRASADGPVKSSVNYEQWLRMQPAATQDEILGPARAKLFRSGKINLSDLVKQDRSIVTLEELRSFGPCATTTC